jgi:hypothetical protein
VAKQGPVALKLTGGDGLLAWVDGKPITFKSETTRDLEAGTHKVVVKLETKKLPEAIRLESGDATILAE